MDVPNGTAHVSVEAVQMVFFYLVLFLHVCWQDGALAKHVQQQISSPGSSSSTTQGNNCRGIMIHYRLIVRVLRDD